MPSSSDQIYGITTAQVAVAGFTNGNALLVEGIAYQKFIQFKYVSGGSLAYFGCPLGQTLSAASQEAGFSNAYLPGATEAPKFEGPTRFYLAALGGAAVVSLVRGLSSGYTSGT